ncbi:MAG TPA: hypothetical protein VLB46_03955 [Pyrinomonadaceae bacterium]|nr:hypothetical protein [Pyrinomonadaceae bacterium]
MNRIYFIWALISRTACVLVVCSLLTHAQQNAKRDARMKSARIDAFIANASAAMPEVAVDLLIKIAESNLISDRQKRIDLLEEAFRRSGEVQEMTRRKIWTGPVDSRSGFLSAAFDQQLDALSLRCRVVRAMLSLDPERARKLFLEVPTIKVKELSCSQNLAYDMTDFYKTLSMVAAKSFSAAEVEQGEKLRFIQSYVETIQSPAQVSPIINVLIDSALPAPDLSVVGKSLSNALGKVSTDPRSLDASLLHGNLITNLERLLRFYSDHDLPTAELLGSFRSYLLAQLNSVQCSDVAASTSRTKQIWESLDKFSTWLNEPIKADDVKPSRIEQVNSDEHFWTSSQSYGLLVKLKALRFGEGTVPLPVEARAANDWQQKMEMLLADVDQWDGTSEKSALTHFHEKANLYSGLFELTPSNDNKLRVLLRFAGYLRNSEAKEQSHIEWLWHLHSLLRKIKQLDTADRTRVFDVFKNSGNQALQLYSDYDLLLTAPVPAKSQRAKA